jgi:hypothetical protein
VLDDESRYEDYGFDFSGSLLEVAQPRPMKYRLAGTVVGGAGACRF